jgi:hypothetical protein
MVVVEVEACATPQLRAVFIQDRVSDDFDQDPENPFDLISLPCQCELLCIETVLSS